MNTQDADGHDQDSEESNVHASIETLNHEMEDRSQDGIAHQLAKTAMIAPHFRVAHNDTLKPLSEGISAIAHNSKNDIYKNLTRLNRQVYDIYKSNRLSSVETKIKVIEPLVK